MERGNYWETIFVIVFWFNAIILSFEFVIDEYETFELKEEEKNIP